MPRVGFFPVLLTMVACGGAGSAPAPAPAAPRPVERAAEPAEHALAGLAAQHLVVLPLYSVRVMPDLAWTADLGRPADYARTVDADILAAFDETGVRKNWIFPEQLSQAYRRNSTYATDPYGLAEEPLRFMKAGLDTRLPEPIASQLRTLIALHDDTRFVLAPVELRLERAGAGGQGVLRLLLIDPRLSNVRWLGDIVSDSAGSFGPVISASIAAKLARAVSTK